MFARRLNPLVPLPGHMPVPWRAPQAIHLVAPEGPCPPLDKPAWSGLPQTGHRAVPLWPLHATGPWMKGKTFPKSKAVLPLWLVLSLYPAQQPETHKWPQGRNGPARN